MELHAFCTSPITSYIDWPFDWLILQSLALLQMNALFGDPRRIARSTPVEFRGSFRFSLQYKMN